MGTYIAVHAEYKTEDGQYKKIDTDEPLFDFQSYRVFGFLANVCNYSAIIPLSKLRGFPEDASAEVKRIFSHEYEVAPSWLNMDELLNFNYGQLCEDRRVTRQTGPNTYNGVITCEPGEGETMTYREFLGEMFFEELDKLKELKADRIVFWFD